MQCLSLRGSHRLHSLEGLPQLAELCSLDIAGLSQLSQDSALHIARLPHLVVSKLKPGGPGACLLRLPCCAQHMLLCCVRVQTACL